MYYIVDDDGDLKFTDVDDLCEYLFDPENYNDDDSLDEWIDEMYYDQRCEIGGETFYPAAIVRELSWSTYTDLKAEWAQQRSESDTEYYRDDIENMDPGEENWFGDYKVKCYEDEDDKDEDEDKVAEIFNEIVQVNYTARTISDSPVSVQVIR